MVHDMKIWTMTNDKIIVTCHIAIGMKPSNLEGLKRLKKQFQMTYPTQV